MGCDQSHNQTTGPKQVPIQETRESYVQKPSLVNKNISKDSSPSNKPIVTPSNARTDSLRKTNNAKRQISNSTSKLNAHKVNEKTVNSRTTVDSNRSGSNSKKPSTVKSNTNLGVSPSKVKLEVQNQVRQNEEDEPNKDLAYKQIKLKKAAGKKKKADPKLNELMRLYGI